MTPGRDITSTQEHRDKLKKSSSVKSKGGEQKPKFTVEQKKQSKSKGGEQKPNLTVEESNLHHLDLASYQEIKKLLEERHLFEDTVLPTVQRLYDVCVESLVRGGAAPSPQAVENIRIVLDTIKGSDVGLHETNNPKLYSTQSLAGTHAFRANGRRHGMLAKKLSSTAAPVISYLHLHECDTVSMGIFCLPATATIPLHNHPGMTVLSKLLYGSLRVKSYDWVEPFDDAKPSKPRLAKLVKEQVLTAPCKPEVLYPHGGNIHSLTALTPCAVLDVQAPPYSPDAGRHCIYFRASPLSSISVALLKLNSNKDTNDRSQNHVWLEEFEPPVGFVQRGVYHGPKIRPWQNDNVSIQADFRGPSS